MVFYSDGELAGLDIFRIEILGKNYELRVDILDNVQDTMEQISG